jgi:hypothetical protein
MFPARMALVLGCLASPGQQEEDERRALLRRLQDPAQVFPYFQDLIRKREYAKAQELLTPAARRLLPTEAFTLTFSRFDASRRLVASFRVHRAETLSGERAAIRICSREFGSGREISLERFGPGPLWYWAIGLTQDDVEHLKGRALSWHRHQVERADGWQFAYPPDWSYAPLGRACGCGK